jgi:hypothetical protein
MSKTIYLVIGVGEDDFSWAIEAYSSEEARDIRVEQLQAASDWFVKWLDDNRPAVDEEQASLLYARYMENEMGVWQLSYQCPTFFSKDQIELIM